MCKLLPRGQVHEILDQKYSICVTTPVLQSEQTGDPAELIKRLGRDITGVWAWRQAVVLNASACMDVAGEVNFHFQVLGLSVTCDWCENLDRIFRGSVMESQTGRFGFWWGVHILWGAHMRGQSWHGKLDKWYYLQGQFWHQGRETKGQCDPAWWKGSPAASFTAQLAPLDGSWNVSPLTLLMDAVRTYPTSRCEWGAVKWCRELCHEIHFYFPEDGVKSSCQGKKGKLLACHRWEWKRSPIKVSENYYPILQTVMEGKNKDICWGLLLTWPFLWLPPRRIKPWCSLLPVPQKQPSHAPGDPLKRKGKE